MNLSSLSKLILRIACYGQDPSEVFYFMNEGKIVEFPDIRYLLFRDSHEQDFTECRE